MNVLPRILYPIQMLPLWMPRKVASSIEKLFSEFVRHGKKPREKNKILQMQSNTGGLGLPNILFYNWACHAWIIWGWLCYYLDSTFRVDSWTCTPLSLWGMINCKRQNVAKEFKVNLIVYNSVKVWRDIVSFFGRKDLVSMLRLIKPFWLCLCICLLTVLLSKNFNKIVIEKKKKSAIQIQSILIIIIIIGLQIAS